ncbi:MAG: DUF3169 family protein [Clostridiales bacterium]|nr:DUF3169 family protein [Clostridiales bacterium]
MNKKLILKMVIFLIIGGIVGAGLTLGLEAGKEIINNQILPTLADYLMTYSFYITIAVTLALFIPTVINFTKGKKLLSKAEGLEDEALDTLEKEAQKYSNKAMAYNNILLVLNFMMYGMSFDVDAPYFLAKTVLFMIIAIGCSTTEILAVKLMQKYDNRLKGDPTSLKFQKDSLESCDEAEKLKIYESGFKSFQFVKNAALVMVILSILLKITGFIGTFPVFIVSLFLFIIIASYNYYAIKADQ